MHRFTANECFVWFIHSFIEPKGHNFVWQVLHSRIRHSLWVFDFILLFQLKNILVFAWLSYTKPMTLSTVCLGNCLILCDSTLHLLVHIRKSHKSAKWVWIQNVQWMKNNVRYGWDCHMLLYIHCIQNVLRKKYIGCDYSVCGAFLLIPSNQHSFKVIFNIVKQIFWTEERRCNKPTTNW